ncbi:glycine cleavage system aminomethyltransferase GcvT [Aestuariivirga litoralis]|uniref:glycine cleavage system aminomethyltransferase GcvT n=1 Tax=Aestuariivirga litoralis TaxID=2650924 RepID=UPI0018C4DCD8|nr:glycine cleavage system aminomethyltransferase GcvT [Aestuariivirga litoralis]MBG1233347.1 glycine cleavage system aminomethyltransferase GcvT [Aestuariivirga litoralis]
MDETALRRTPLYDLHVALGAKMVPFAGYYMPVQYPTGIMAEHKWCRENAGLFEVSHMGQCSITGPDFQTTARAMEMLVPADVLSLAPGQQRYSQLMNVQGGISDDLMITHSNWEGLEGSLYVVVNASRKGFDFDHIEENLPPGLSFKRYDSLALMALQGPKAEGVLAALNPAVKQLAFMSSGRFMLGGMEVHVSRSGYTGEDGFELSVEDKDAATLWNRLLENADVKPVGLGARDSLRLEAGLCLYGHDIDKTTSPIEAGLQWSIAKRRRVDGGFPGSRRVQRELLGGVSRKRIGIKPEGRAPARDGTEIQDETGRKIGVITSGGFGPTVNGPIAMGYVETAYATPGTPLQLIVRGQAMPAQAVSLPFIPNRFKR